MMSAIRDVSLSFLAFVEQALRDDPHLSPYFDPADPTPSALGTMILTLDTPQEMEENDQEGVSLWLYLVQRDEQTLNRPPRRVGLDQLERRPLPLRLHYLVTPIVDREVRTDAAELEQLVLGKILQIFHDEASIAGARLRGMLAGSGLEFFVRLEPLSLEEITRVWDALDRPYQLCVSYEVSVVPIASAFDPARIVPVDLVTTETGPATLTEPA